MSQSETETTARSSPSLEAGGMPLHRQLFLVLREQISRGALRPGQALPTELALGEQFGVSRITVRRALQDLSDQGYVQRRHGRGTYVLDRWQPMPSGPPLTVMDGLLKAQLETTVDVMDVELRRPPAAVTAALALDDEADAVYVLRVRRDKTDHTPLMISEAWLPEEFSDVVTAPSLTVQPLYEVLGHAGVEMGRVAQEVTAEIADPLRAQLLQTSIGAALLRINRLIYDSGQRPVQYLSLFLSPDRSRILMDIPATHIDTAASGLVAHDLPRNRRT
jgi:GntR family transcriptional regulator